MYVIGLTGGIASGKSTASDLLRELGARVIDADAISRAVTSEGGEAAPAILERFGTLDRPTLGRIVFGDAQARRDLNAIVHPLVQARMEAEMAASGAPVVVLDVPLLYEAGMEGMADAVWVVYVAREEQIRRVMARDGLSEAEAIARVDSQMPTGEKLRRADATINTSGSFTQTRQIIEDLWHETLERLGATHAMPAHETPIRYRRSAARRAQRRRLEEGDEATPVREEAAAPPKARHGYVPAWDDDPPEEDEDDDGLPDDTEIDDDEDDGGEDNIVPLFTRRTRPAPPSPYERPRGPSGAWDDTSTLLDIPEQRTFFARQPPLFWVAACVLLVALLVVTGIVGVNALRERQAERAEAERLRLLAEEKARYKLDYRDLIEGYAAQAEIDPALVAAVIYNESRFDPEAVSYLGARGLMQIMPDTGDWIAMRLSEQGGYSFDLMFDPETNIRYGTWFLGYLSRMFEGNVVNMAAGYHAGQYAVAGWLENPELSSDGKTLEKIPFPDTEQYVQRVVNAYEIYIRHYYTPEEETAAL